MQPQPPRPPSIRDVAKVAGVAHQTVSRVLSGFPHVSEQTRERVLSAVEEVGYRPNAAAQALVTRRSRTIGVLASSITHYGPSASIAEIENSTRAHGYRMSMTSFDEQDLASARAALDYLLSQRVEALAVVSPVAAVLETIRTQQFHIPVVFLEPMGAAGPCIAYDQVSGVRMAVRSLVELGHRRIVHVAGPVGSLEAEARIEGFHAAMKDAGLVTTPPVHGDWSAATGYRIGLDLLGDTDVTAVVAANDQTAIGLLHASRDLGIHVPEQLSVIGFDDLSTAAHVSPALTTLRQDFTRLGRLAVEFLLGELGLAPSTRPGLLTPELIIRDSTAVAPT